MTGGCGSRAPGAHESVALDLGAAVARQPQRMVRVPARGGVGTRPVRRGPRQPRRVRPVHRLQRPGRRRPVLFRRAGVRGRAGAERDVGPRSRPQHPRQGRAAGRERSRRRCRPASWTRPHRCSGNPIARCSSTAARLDSEIVELGLAEAGPGDSRDRHGAAARARDERVRASGGNPASAGARELEVDSLRDVGLDDLPRARALAGPGDVPPRAARRDGEPARARHGAHAARGGSRRHRPASSTARTGR